MTYFANDDMQGKHQSLRLLEWLNFFLADVQTGVGPFLAAYLASSGWNPGHVDYALTYAVGTIVTIFMSNDATAVVLTPAILTAVRKAKVEPLPYLFVCAFVANAASFLLPISNPANLVVFHNDMPPLGR
jgi:Na+/H+ antiporter NhaD/arsenite permease-like protein